MPKLNVLLGSIFSLILLVGCSRFYASAKLSTDTKAPTCSVPQPSLAAGKLKNKLIGTAYRISYAKDDPCYEYIATHDFASLTTEIGTMTDIVEPVEGKFNFKEADAVYDVAKKNHLDFQIHALIWDPLDHPEWKIVPNWLKNMPPAKRHEQMINLITAVMKHYAGKASAATVVNEAFNQSGELRHNAWWETTRSDQYIIDAFTAARIADPQALLFYNDYNAETHNGKSDAIYALVKKLRSIRVPVKINGNVILKPIIDGIGFQCHMLGGKNQQPSISDMRSNFQRFADLGLIIRFTEMDVRIPVTNGVSQPDDINRQAKVYGTMTSLCVQQPKCDGITFWGFTDKRSWITDYPDTFSGYGAADLYDSRYKPKPARTAVIKALED